MAERLIPERLKIRPEQLSAAVPLEEIEQQPLGTRFAPSDKVAERTFLYPGEDVFDRKINEQSQEQMDKAQSDVDRAIAFTEQAKANLAQATLYSPVGGTVITLEISPGEVVTPGQIVIVIADLSQMQVETTDLSERDILAVQIGQQAKVFIEALDESFEGRVTDIARRSSTVGGDVVYTVTIELDDQPDGLRWGMSAEAEIQTEQ